MHRRIAVFLVLLLFTLCIAAYSSAVPLLVELKIKDATGSLDNPNTGDDGLNSPGSSGGKGKSNEKKGGNGGSGGGADLKSLTLWLSSNGKDWQVVSSDLLSYSSDKITAQITGKGKGSADDLFGSTGQDITGEPSQTYYVGLSTSASTFSTTSGLSARLVSWEFFSKTNQAVGIPEPAIWPLFAIGALMLGRSRRKS